MAEDTGIGSRKRRKIGPSSSVPYIFKPLFDEVPVATDDTADVHITCVEYWNELYLLDGMHQLTSASLDDNLYIGTSAAEILHFVSLPPNPSDESNEPSFILASRLPIPFSQSSVPAHKPGIQQIVVLPAKNKACVLCLSLIHI